MIRIVRSQFLRYILVGLELQDRMAVARLLEACIIQNHWVSLRLPTPWDGFRQGSLDDHPHPV